MNLTQALSIIAIFFGSVSVGAAQSQALIQRVDEYVRSEMEKRQIPGLAVAVVKNGQLVMAKGYGMANVEVQVPVKPETLFQTASIGKQFTATAIMMLVEQGKIDLDANIGKYLTDAPPAWSGITVRNLLTHTSGLAGYPEKFDYRRDYTEDELIKIIESEPL